MRRLARPLVALIFFLLVASVSYVVSHASVVSETTVLVPNSDISGPELEFESPQRGLTSPSEDLYLIGQLGPRDDGDFLVSNADIWAHGDYAYVSTFSCSPQGVRVIDISDPTRPQRAITIPAPSASHVNDVKVARVSTPSFDGVLLAHSAERCSSGGFSGFRLYDVTNPTNPGFLSNFAAGDVHNLYLYAVEDRAYVLLADPYGEVFGTGGHPFSDLLIVNVTDPTDPRLESSWTLGRDAGLAFGSPSFTQPSLPAGSDCTPPPGTPVLCRGDSPAVFLHDVWAGEDGQVAYLSYWDAGLVLVDISDPAAPVFLGYGLEPPTFGSDEGNAHAAVPARGGDLVLVADEDFQPGPYGFLRIFDASDPTNPVQIGAFATENSLINTANSATIHNIYVVGDVAFLSWYTEGIRVVDFSDPTQPQEVGGFDGSGSFWGVYVLGGPDQLDSEELLVLGSAMSLGFHALGFDRSPPVSTRTLAGDLGENGWYISRVTATLNATDARSGVASIGYRLDGSAWLNYSAPFLVEGDGGHTLDFFAVDHAGHSEVSQSLRFQIDTTPPELEGLAPEGHLTGSDVLVSWSGEDATSGLVRYEVHVDEEPPQDVGLQDSISLTLADGAHTVRVVAFDAAGNIAQAQTTISVDTNVFSPTGPYSGLPLYALLGGVAAAATGALVWIVRGRRRAGRP
ncbi:MAG: OmpL47-type beta-barrel domain-containing protein [Thermoplasmata archaeon]